MVIFVQKLNFKRRKQLGHLLPRIHHKLVCKNAKCGNYTQGPRSGVLSGEIPLAHWMFKILHIRFEVKTYEMGMGHLWLKWMGGFMA